MLENICISDFLTILKIIIAKILVLTKFPNSLMALNELFYVIISSIT